MRYYKLEEEGSVTRFLALDNNIFATVWAISYLKWHWRVFDHRYKGSAFSRREAMQQCVKHLNMHNVCELPDNLKVML
jgi:hypothetical protein